MIGSTLELQNFLRSRLDIINEWFNEKINFLKEKSIPFPLFSSFDVRDSGYKASIVDSNVFPSGFNNLDLTSRDLASKKVTKYLSSISPKKVILLIPENYSRNKNYFKSLQVLSNIMKKGGYKIIYGYLEYPNIQPPLDNSLNHIVKMIKKKNMITTENFQDGFIILNNDLTGGNPSILNDVKQIVIPHISLGWYNRKKSSHFQFYNNLIEELASIVSFDPWLLKAAIYNVDPIDFKYNFEIELIAEKVDRMVENVAQKYAEYNIHEEPYVFLKNNSGTLGLGIISIKSSDELKNLNSKKRKKMLIGKQGAKITSILLQEGIPTKYTMGQHPAEPVIYCVGTDIIGGFIRLNLITDKFQNLNTKGLFFEQLYENELTHSIIFKDKEFSLYVLISKIAILAISYELMQNLSG